MTPCILISIAVPVSYSFYPEIYIKKKKNPRFFLDLLLMWNLLSREKTVDSLSYARQCIKEGHTVLMTKMSRRHSWKTSKNVFNFIMCRHVRRKGLAVY
jgi:hypothetical protein